MKKAAVFLDRDGTINQDPGYLGSPDELVVFPAARQGLKLLTKLGYPLFVVTNQSGLGRGYFGLSSLEAIHRKLESELAQDGVRFEEIIYCPHRPDEDCSCRKPSPGMIFKLANTHDIDLSASFLIGDSPSDIETGRRAGCRTILLADRRAVNRMRKDNRWNEPDFIVSDLWKAAILIRDLKRGQDSRS